ncbi:flagellar basal body P-ring formation chaperone FlgA [Sphingomonas psychrotolerans]|uniref:Flagella basal body P-ring formation protein FlgA n=1 Tax=Sphingomonas psychrotolerans TaxID=1327635 RepID=A0ABU3N4Q5_9SPHN|nr:flagellar basal body P-ring formation chaperone FlgA [Sphingomonas psychrotolerans]MDT8758491.1 flagellar basal body P-ring formation chaperone FlgA [Sphingomonas psychrotolerans]
MGVLLALALLGAGPAEDVQVAVLAHPVEKGTRLERGDFELEARAPAAARGVLSAEDAAGMEAARNLTAGMTVRRSDLMKPQLVRRGEPVTIRIVAGALVITASGRALNGGGQGEMVRVVTNNTNRTLDGTIDGSGTVRIAAP